MVRKTRNGQPLSDCRTLRRAVKRAPGVADGTAARLSSCTRRPSALVPGHITGAAVPSGSDCGTDDLKQTPPERARDAAPHRWVRVVRPLRLRLRAGRRIGRSKTKNTRIGDRIEGWRQLRQRSQDRSARRALGVGVDVPVLSNQGPDGRINDLDCRRRVAPSPARGGSGSAPRLPAA